jgi:hypothetical protein
MSSNENEEVFECAENINNNNEEPIKVQVSIA